MDLVARGEEESRGGSSSVRLCCCGGEASGGGSGVGGVRVLPAGVHCGEVRSSCHAWSRRDERRLTRCDSIDSLRCSERLTVKFELETSAEIWTMTLCDIVSHSVTFCQKNSNPYSRSVSRLNSADRWLSKGSPSSSVQRFDSHTALRHHLCTTPTPHRTHRLHHAGVEHYSHTSPALALADSLAHGTCTRLHQHHCSRTAERLQHSPPCALYQAPAAARPGFTQRGGRMSRRAQPPRAATRAGTAAAAAAAENFKEASRSVSFCDIL